MYIKMKCMTFSVLHRWNFKALVLQKVKHIIKFMCVYVLLAVPLKEKGGKSLNGIFSVRSNNLKKKFTGFSGLQGLQTDVFKSVSFCYRNPCTDLGKMIQKNVYVRRKDFNK